MSDHFFDYERLDAYKIALLASRAVAALDFGDGRGRLRDQAVRAAESAVLNIAEGRMRQGKTRHQHYRIALGSAGEACAALDILNVPECQPIQSNLRRVGAMLHRMSRPGPATP